MSGWTTAWLLWIAMFFAIEVPALVYRQGQGDTLSEHVWKWFAVTWDGTKPAQWRARRAVLIAFLGWLSLHFLTGGQF